MGVVVESAIIVEEFLATHCVVIGAVVLGNSAAVPMAVLFIPKPPLVSPMLRRSAPR
jgi:hypothetical protein